jgi:hypothetical protein
MQNANSRIENEFPESNDEKALETLPKTHSIDDLSTVDVGPQAILAPTKSYSGK